MGVIRKVIGGAALLFVLAALVSAQSTTTGGQTTSKPEGPAPEEPPAAGTDMDKAAALYKSKCLPCHGVEGKSQLPGMSLADGVWKHGTSVKEIAQTITNGVPGTPMIAFKAQLKEDEILLLAHYVRTFDKTLKPEGKKE
jgi:mono/diheme cytochrome c family protein